MKRPVSTKVLGAGRRVSSIVLVAHFMAGCAPDESHPIGPSDAASRATAAKLTGVVTDVVFPPSTSTATGTAWGRATAINEAGVVAGVRSVIGGATNVFLWKDGNVTLLPGGMTPVALNKRLEIAGNTAMSPSPSFSPVQAGGTNRAVLMKDGIITDLGTLGGAAAFATDINDKAQIVGWSQPTPGSGLGSRAFLWEDGEMSDLGTLGGTTAVAWGINNHGQVVGSSTTATGATHAFLWQTGTMIDLGVLGGNFSSAGGINDRGQVVGLSDPPAGSFCERVPFIWERGTMSAVPLGSRSCIWSMSVRDISDAGHIVGTSFGSSGNWRSWVFRDGVWLDLPASPGENAVFRVNSSGEVPGFSNVSVGVGGAFVWSVGRHGP